MPLLPNEEVCFPVPALVEIKPHSVNCHSTTDQKSHFNKSIEKGLRNPPSFLSLINPFIEISYPESSKAVLLRKSLDRTTS